MNRNDFGSWGVELTAREFALALAALGVQRGSQALPYASDVAQEITSLVERGLPLGWNVEGWLRAAGKPGRSLDLVAMPARVLADAWSEVAALYGEPVGDTYFSRDPRRIRLEVRGGRIADFYWLAEQLSQPSVRATSVYRLSAAWETEITWDWPLRVGFLGDDASLPLRGQLQALIGSRDGEWLGPLVKLIEIDAGSVDCDLLILPHDLRPALGAVLQGPSALRADCVLVLGRIEDAAERAYPLVGALRAQARAGGVALSHVPATPAAQGEEPSKQQLWFKELLRQLSHNEPIDVALYRAARNGRVESRTPLLFASRQLIDHSRISRRIEQLGYRLSALRVDDVKMNGEDVGLEGKPTLGEVSGGLTGRADELPWDHETDTATTFSRFKKAAGAAMEEAPPPQTNARWIQVEAWEYAEGRRREAARRVLRAGSTYDLSVFIGSPTQESISADRPFAEEALPPNMNEHRLTVVFTEPRIAPEPKVATITLPRRGDSTRCDFFVLIPEEGVSRMTARVTVLHKNRVLQTALLSAAVVRGEGDGQGKDEAIELIVESVLRPGMDGLTGRRWFDAALVLNHTPDGDAQITKSVGEQAALIPIGDLAPTVKWFDDQITDVANNWEKFERLDTKKSRDLLWACAVNGSELFNAIIAGRAADDPLVKAERVQVVSARYGARFPMEFVYGRMAPLPEAPLCPEAAASLMRGRCDGKCPAGPDEEKVICPLGFWGLNRIIERHAYDPQDIKALSGADFAIQSEPVEGRNRLNVLASAVVATSDNVDEVEKGSKQRVIDALDAATRSQAKTVSTWEEWVEEIDGRSPSLLVLLPHTVREVLSRQQMLEISADKRLLVANIQQKHVLGPGAKQSPVVLLMGCKTAAPDIAYESFVLKFRLKGAALVVGTGSTILGRHAARVAQEFIVAVAGAGNGETPFGQVMLDVRRRMMADGLLMVLCLTSYGDTDWLI